MQGLARFERSAFAALTALAAAIVVALPVIPGHDVPQHLAYVRLIATWQDNPHSLPDVYAPPDVSNVYSTSYRVLAWIAQWTSPEVSLRIALVAYVVLLSIALRELVRATWRQRGAPMTSLLAPVAAFNPVLCMGLLAYVFALVPFIGACASAIAFMTTGRKRQLALAALLAAATATLHGVASAALVLFVGLVALFRRDRRAFAALGACVAGVAFTSRVVGAVASVPSETRELLVRNMREYGAVPGFVGTFRISFTHWYDKLDQIGASVLGPFPHAEKVLSAMLFASVVVVALRAPKRDDGEHAAGPLAGVRPAFAVFALVAILAPAAIQIPDDICLLDFRLITTGTLLGVAALPVRSLARGRAPAVALVIAAAASLLLWARQLEGTASEVMQMVRLTDRLAKEDRLLALPMHDASAYLDPNNEVLHYSAVHHTARGAGVTSLFWGRFTPRLPVGYRPGREPPHPHDWAPWGLEDEHLQAFSHIVVRWPREDDDERLRELARRVMLLRAHGVLDMIACEGDCCLFAISVTKIAR